MNLFTDLCPLGVRKASAWHTATNTDLLSAALVCYVSSASILRKLYVTILYATVQKPFNDEQRQQCCEYFTDRFRIISNNCKVIELQIAYATYTVSQKKQSKLFSSELRQISINFDNFWQKDGQDDEIM